MRRDGEQVGLEHGEANVAEDVRQICARWGGRDVDEEAEKVERPLLPVFEDFKEKDGADGLSIAL